LYNENSDDSTKAINIINMLTDMLSYK
jgi:hypothetical protein